VRGQAWPLRCGQIHALHSNEIASCGEKAYTNLPIADAATLLFFTEMKDLMEFAQKVRALRVRPPRR
jgi:hypothetical protein